jgi:tetratricopeptide (TPR) repeat protein
MRSYFLILLGFLTVQIHAQTDFYDQLKKDYERFRKEEKHDSALVIAKQMNAWALQMETDTSLRYAVSLRYVGNCFGALEKHDSSCFYFNSSIGILEKQKRDLTQDYATALTNIGNTNSRLEKFQDAIICFEKTINLRVARLKTL